MTVHLYSDILLQANWWYIVLYVCFKLVLLQITGLLMFCLCYFIKMKKG